MLGKHTMTTRRRQDVTMERKRIPVRERGDRRRGEGKGVGDRGQQGKKAQPPKMLDLESGG